MRVLGSAEDAQASMRACKLEPLPEMRTTRLYCDDDMLCLQDGGLCTYAVSFEKMFGKHAG